MTDIIKLARESELNKELWLTNECMARLERFAELVAKQKREAKESPCKTCKHFTQGKNPLVGVYDMDCFECTNYYASKWEAKEPT